MAWTYSDYITSPRGGATYLERLRLHVQEVSDVINSSIAADGKSENFTDLRLYHQKIMDELHAAEQLASNRTNGGVSRVRLGKAL